MRRSVFTTLLQLPILLAASMAVADGLIYQLPEDGISIEYDIQAKFDRDGTTNEFAGTFSVSSVGTETVDGNPCRWIEFRMEMQRGDRQETHAVKALIPEAELTRGKSPLRHIKRAWYRNAADEVQEITDITSPIAGPLPAFLAGPFTDAQLLDSAVIETGLGKFECAGIRGSTEYKAGTRDMKSTFTSRLHESSPFGVAAAEIEIVVTRDGEVEETGTMTFVAKNGGRTPSLRYSADSDRPPWCHCRLAQQCHGAGVPLPACPAGPVPTGRGVQVMHKCGPWEPCRHPQIRRFEAAELRWSVRSCSSPSKDQIPRPAAVLQGRRPDPSIAGGVSHRGPKHVISKGPTGRHIDRNRNLKQKMWGTTRWEPAPETQISRGR